MQNMMGICISSRLCLMKFPRISSYQVHEGEGVALNGPSVQTLKELRGETWCCGAFLAPEFVSQQRYLCPRFEKCDCGGRGRQKEPLLLQPKIRVVDEVLEME